MAEIKINWDDLAQSVADGEAILILGPDAIPFYPVQGGEGVSFGQRARQHILEALNGQISHFYHRDDLFQFSNVTAKQQAMKEVRATARDANWLPDTELVRQIVAMPFPIVLNLNPDKCIYEAFLSYYREPQFDYFTTKNKPNSPRLTYPDGLNTPLLYNLCGSVLDKLDSVILDYNDLFELLKNLLMDSGVSEFLTQKLQEADRFVLLGFELDRWYSQLLLHYLNKSGQSPFNNPKQNFPILSHVTDDARAFVMQQFNIQHIASSRDDFEQLYQACARKGILRNLKDPASPAETQIRMLTVQGKYEEAFILLEQQVDTAVQNLDLLHLRSRYNAWLEQKKAGISDNRDLELEINRIRYTLLTYANQISAL